MRVCLIAPEAGRVSFLNVRNTLEALQGMVGGYIETATPQELTDEGICLICNEEGVLKGLTYNENLYPFFYVGNVLAVGVDGEEFAGLTEYQQDFITYWLENLS